METGSATRRKQIIIVAVTAAVIAYPIIAHGSLMLGQRFVGLAFALVLGVAVLWSMRRRGPIVLLAAAVVLAVIVFAAATSRLEHLIYVPPVVITLLLAWGFGRTLMPGRTPLVTMLATKIRGELDPRVARYTRQVTQMWFVFLILLTAELIILAMFAPVETWSLFANGLNYVFVVALFIAEYVFRRIYLSDIHHRSFLDYLKGIRAADFRSAIRQSKREP